MTNDKKLTAVAAVASLALMLLSGASLAGHGKHKDPLGADPAKHAAKLAEKLSLSDAQAADVEQILAEARAEKQSIGDTYTLNQKDQAKTAMKELHGRTSERIYALLDADQQATFDEMQAKRKMRAEHRKEKMELKKQQRAELRGDG
ncbi:MAG: hypothetical protein AAF229_04240 [Pseudomonadota bacterium]